MQSAQKTFDLENDIKLVDPTRDALYAYNAAADREAKLGQPWKTDRAHYKHIRISAVALLKMVTHAREGGRLEVMGLMSGTVSGDTFIVTDAYRLPVEGTETRVNAYEDAYEYMTEYPRLSKMAGRMEDAVGWYHSHPGYGCWLSGIDVATQQSWQTQDPFVAVVIDPDRTVSGGKVEIGAFRTYRNAIEVNAGGASGGEWATGEGGSASSAAAAKKSASASASAAAAAANTSTDISSSTRKQKINSAAAGGGGGSLAAVDKSSLTTEKAQDLGMHAEAYYALQVSHFRSTLDTAVLEALWRKYWTRTLSSPSSLLVPSGSSSHNNNNNNNNDTVSVSRQRDAVSRRILGLAAGLSEVVSNPGGGSRPAAAAAASAASGGPASTGLETAGHASKRGQQQQQQQPNAAVQDPALVRVVEAAEGVAAEEQTALLALRVQEQVFGGGSGSRSGLAALDGASDQLQHHQQQGEADQDAAAATSSHVSPAGTSATGGVTDQLQDLQVQMQMQS